VIIRQFLYVKIPTSNFFSQSFKLHSIWF